MSYERFKLPSTPATLANPATLHVTDDRSVAEIATVAGVLRENQDFGRRSVATVASVCDAALSSVATVAGSVERQTDLTGCWVCGGKEKAERPFIPVCSDVPGHCHWMHSDCWREHVRRVAAARASDPIASGGSGRG